MDANFRKQINFKHQAASHLHGVRFIVPGLRWNAEGSLSVPDAALQAEDPRILSIVVQVDCIQLSLHFLVRTTLSLILTS